MTILQAARFLFIVLSILLVVVTVLILQAGEVADAWWVIAGNVALLSLVTWRYLEAKNREVKVSQSKKQAIFFGFWGVFLAGGAYWSIVYNAEGTPGGRWPFSGTALGVVLAMISAASLIYAIRLAIK